MKPTKWVTQYFEQVWNRTDCLYHIWWENKAMCDIMAEQAADCQKHIEITMKAWHFNAYLRGYQGTRLWQPGDFLVHFAGVYESKQMGDLMASIERGEIPRLPMF